MENKRILELAIAALERQKAVIEGEIESLRSEINYLWTPTLMKATSPKPKRKGGKSAAERKAQSEKMKKIWAARKSKAKKEKPTAKQVKTKATIRNRSKTEAEKKALSLKMKEVWRKKKAEAAIKQEKSETKIGETKKQ